MFEMLALLFSLKSNLFLINSVGTRVLFLTSLPTGHNSVLKNYTCKAFFLPHSLNNIITYSMLSNTDGGLAT